MKNLPFSTAAQGGLLLGLLLAARSGNLLAQVPAAAEGLTLTQPAVLGLLLVVVIGAAIGLLVRVASLRRGRQSPSVERENGRFDEAATSSRSAPVAPGASVGAFR
ncbi:hypothetical protein [Hymenobacter psychrophilus]|uniref:Uncharacterized protein n=1 Tax=Hymenobacter psychrophilus TaxID=651662 RepID=A0A1H3MYL4_9BACT|nr:hypothetical protein [Hymenobacter psychrophilus]SDY81305.1 hypothetical protein SAMN04488069_11448 [Hymenobacter psychrophilus]